jgi:CDP-diacylglycerol--glycerol-3-phosphate 3-phosphatidyltransferase
MNSELNKEPRRQFGRVLHGLSLILTGLSIYFLLEDSRLISVALLGAVFANGWFLLFGLRHYEVEKPYYSLWIRTFQNLMVTSLASVLLYIEWQASDNFPAVLFTGWLFFLTRSIAYPIYGIAMVRDDMNANPVGMWSKAARLSITIALMFYLLEWDNYKQILMVIALLLQVASGIAMLYRFYREPSHRKPLSIASQITVSRIILTPLFIWVFFYDSNLSFHDNNLIFKSLAFLMVVLFMFTDWLDGYLARKMNEVSTLGKFLDPFSDKISNMTIFLCFMSSGYASVWMVAAIYFREASVETLRTLAASSNEIIAARQSGKWKTAIQGAGILIILANSILIDFVEPIKYQEFLPMIIMGIITLITLLSGLDYFVSSKNILKKFL